MWWDNIINRLRTSILFGLKIETSGNSWARGSVETNAAENVWNNVGVSWIGENCSNAWFTIPITYWQINQMYDKTYDLLITFIKEHQYKNISYEYPCWTKTQTYPSRTIMCASHSVAGLVSSFMFSSSVLLGTLSFPIIACIHWSNYLLNFLFPPMLNPLYLAQCLLYIRQSENVSRMNEWVSGWKNKSVNF